MKKLCITLLFLFYTSLINANDDIESKGWYFGLTQNSGNGTHEYRGAILNKLKLDSNAKALKFGYDNYFYKIEISYLHNKIKDDQGLSSILHGFDFDYIAILPYDKLKPYLGLGLGMHYWKDLTVDITNNNVSTGETRELEGGSYSFFAGFIYNYKKLDFDMGYKYKSYFWETAGYGANNTPLDQETNLNYLYFGINYRL